MGGRPSYLQLLRKRSFAALWSSQLVSVSGDSIFDVALLWLVLVKTNSPALVGVTEAAVVLPAVIAGPIAGVYTDRANRRNLMIFSNIAQGAITAALAFLYLGGLLAFPVLIVLVLVLYTVATFFAASLTAMLPIIVEKASLGAANGLMTLTTSANQLVGFAVGGVVLATVGPTGSMTYDSLTFFAAAALLTIVARSYGQPLKVAGQPQESFSKSFSEGLRYVRSNRLFPQLVTFGVLVNFLAGGLSAILAPYVRLQLHGDGLVYGIELAAIALEYIVGAGAVGKLNFRGYVGKVLLLGVAATGALSALAGLVTSVPVAFVVFFALGVFVGSVNVPISVLVQTKAPNELLGRISTVLRALLTAATPVGAVIFGVLAQAEPVGTIFLGVGSAMFVVCLVLYFPFRELREASF